MGGRIEWVAQVQLSVWRGALVHPTAISVRTLSAGRTGTDLGLNGCISIGVLHRE